VSERALVRHDGSVSLTADSTCEPDSNGGQVKSVRGIGNVEPWDNVRGGDGISSATITSPRLLLEPKAADFPYYADSPPTISNAGWLLVLAGTVAGFAALVTPLPFEDGILSGWLRAAAFVGLPLLALTMAAPGRWGAIFRRVGLRDVLLMFGFAILNIIVTMSVGARLVLTWAYVSTKNIWVTTGAHIINDWTLIGMTVFVAPLAAAV